MCQVLKIHHNLLIVKHSFKPCSIVTVCIMYIFKRVGISITLQGFLEQVKHYIRFKISGLMFLQMQIIPTNNNKKNLNLKRVLWSSRYSLSFSFLPLPSTPLILMDTRKGITKSKIQIIIRKRGVFKGFTKIKRWVEVHSFPGESSYIWTLQQQMEFA